MTTQSWSISDDLSSVTIAIAALVLGAWMVVLLLELRKRERYGLLIFGTGLFSVLALGAAVFRPVHVRTRGSMLGPKVIVLVDQSRRLLLPEGDTTRRELAKRAVSDLRDRYRDARLSVMGFGKGAPEPIDLDSPTPEFTEESDLSSAIAALSQDPEGRPQSLIVVSDGRLSRPGAAADDEVLKRSVGGLGVPVHSVRLAEDAPRDASIRAVRAAGAAVAHQPLALTVDVGCSEDLDCSKIPVTVRELRRGVEPAVLATGTAQVKEGSAKLELRVTLERAGARIVEVSIGAPEGDSIPENNKRLLTFAVARDRIRLLHVAGRPTYDVRALRKWLKSDEAIDLVAFFILRTESDDPLVDDDSDLALIPFPVDELFTEHLPSFDAVILQDIDAVAYKLRSHLSRLRTYVRAGGGLIMVGGPASFVGGRYAGTELEDVLPVALDPKKSPFEVQPFEPVYSEAGRVAPVLRQLRELLGERLPNMPGSNTLGKAKPGSIVLWTHPGRSTGSGPMPVLALGEIGDGRSIALGVDGTHLLAFSELAAQVAGRGYGALWEGLLGWLMRDPRYEGARIELTRDCIAKEPATLRLIELPGMQGDVEVELFPLGQSGSRALRRTVKDSGGEKPIEIDLGRLEAGGYTARARVGAAPPTRFDFACERGGEAFRDTRPDPERLERIAQVTGGRSVTLDKVEQLPEVPSAQVAAERHVSPVAPPWLWTLAAAFGLGTHWVARRRGGLV